MNKWFAVDFDAKKKAEDDEKWMIKVVNTTKIVGYIGVLVILIVYLVYRFLF
jgi:hypothetical protein